MLRLEHRERAQITPLALYAAVVLVAAVALVVDAGVFFVTQRQLQTAVDAAALAAVWYHPVCDSLGSDCQGTPSPAPALPTPPASWPPCDPAAHFADCMANAVLQENLGYTGALCSTVAPGTGSRTKTANNLTYYVLTVECDAPYWFARIFPSIPATLHIRASAEATIGYPSATGVTATNPNAPNPPPPLTSRLFS